MEKEGIQEEKKTDHIEKSKFFDAVCEILHEESTQKFMREMNETECGKIIQSILEMISKMEKSPLEISLSDFRKKIQNLFENIGISSLSFLDLIKNTAKESSMENFSLDMLREEIQKYIITPPNEKKKSKTGELFPGFVLSELLIFFLQIPKIAQIFQEISQNDFIESEEVFLSLEEALACLLDEERTKRFLESIQEAIAQVKERKDPSQKIYVCEAGCGPVPILSIFSAILDPFVAVTAIEGNKNSHAIAQKIINALGIKNITLIQGDATEIAFLKKFDILISETMHSGLRDEPMVQIFDHMKKFLEADGEMIPKQVNLIAGLILAEEHSKIFRGPKIKFDHRIFPASIPCEWQKCASYNAKTGLPENTVHLTLDTSNMELGEQYLLYISNTVEVFQKRDGTPISLDIHDALITYPQSVNMKIGYQEKPIRLILVWRGNENFPKDRPKIHIRYPAGSDLLLEEAVQVSLEPKNTGFSLGITSA